MLKTYTAPSYRPLYRHRSFPPSPRRNVASSSKLRRRFDCRSLDDDEASFDIDALAKKLSQEAQNRRASLRASFDCREADFDVDDFEVVQTLGYLSVRSSKTRDRDAAAVVAFVARYFTGRPYQYPVLTLLKEYLPSVKGIAENEFGAMMQLMTIPEDKWEAANDTTDNGIPVVQLLGYFHGTAIDDEGEIKDDEIRQSLWLVFKWEAMKPLSAYHSTEQMPPSMIWPWVKSKEKERQARCKMLRSIFRGVMESVRFCHEKGIVHGSLGSGSVLLSTFDDYQADRLRIKLDNFGFASRIIGDAGEDKRREDIQSVGVLFLETVILALREEEETETPAVVERLALEIYKDDFDGLRGYCTNEPNWSEAVSFLNERNEAGWKLLKQLLNGSFSFDVLDLDSLA